MGPIGYSSRKNIFLKNTPCFRGETKRVRGSMKRGKRRKRRISPASVGPGGRGSAKGNGYLFMWVRVGPSAKRIFGSVARCKTGQRATAIPLSSPIPYTHSSSAAPPYRTHTPPPPRPFFPFFSLASSAYTDEGGQVRLRRRCGIHKRHTKHSLLQKKPFISRKK